MIKPTDENLAIYESWSSSVTQSEVYFGEKVNKCYKCVVKQGHTLFVPTGELLSPVFFLVLLLNDVLSVLVTLINISFFNFFKWC